MKLSKYLLTGITASMLFLTSYQDQKAYAKKKDSVVSIKTFNKLEKLVTNNEYLAVGMEATWCGPCRQYRPIFEKVAKKYKNQVVFSRITLDKITKKERNKIDKKYQIDWLPTTLLFRQRKKVKKEEGYLSENELTKLVEDYLLKK